MRFADIAGQEELKRHLVRSADTGRVSHAQLFAGGAGTGALALAVAYVQYLNCTDRQGGDSCGECPNCRQIAALAHPDLHFVFPVNKQGKKSGEAVLSDDFMPLWRELFAERAGVFSPQEWYGRLDLGRTLKGAISAREADAIIRKLSFKSFSAAYKCVVIWLPETMNEEAANKILKILEEPWPGSLFLLVGERPDLLLPTILSRTQQIAVPRLSDEAVRQQIERSGERDPEKIRTFVRLCAGDLLELRRLLAGEENETQQEYFALFCSLMRLSYNDKHLELMSWAEEVAQLSRERQLAFLKDVVRLLRESYLLHAGLGEISCLWGEEARFCRNFAPFVDNRNIEALVAEIETAGEQIRQNGNPTIVFTHFALSVSKMINKL
ncbi:MAG: DNA polymerase III subunit delta [Alistipes sp.]|nr:DNA polymerase III subunit delta [Alistipes sp.]